MFEETADGLRIRVRLTPGAAANRIDGPVRRDDGSEVLKVRVTAPPADGQANAALVKLLAKSWKVPKTAIDIVAGASDREKTLLIGGDARRLHREIRDRLAG